MKRAELIKQMQHKVAVSAVPLSAVRAQGPGVLSASQKFLTRLRLAKIPKSEMAFRQWLNRQTHALLDQLPVAHRPWGTARKVINLFLRDALYNRYLADAFNLNQLQKWLEIPLDGAVAQGLKRKAGRGSLPPLARFKKTDPTRKRPVSRICTFLCKRSADASRSFGYFSMAGEPLSDG